MEEYLTNKNVRFPEVLLIDENGNQLGVMSSRNAYYKAMDAKLDLVCVAPKASTPVCKLMDYGKFRYEQQKKEKANLKKQREAKIETREIQMTYMIQQNDMNTKINTCKRLIKEGDNVRIVLRLRGRETNFEKEAKEKLQLFINGCMEFASIKKNVHIEGRDIKCILEPKKV